MKKQYEKNLKERFQLPGKLALALENLVGKIQEFFSRLINNNPELLGTDFACSR